MVVADFATSSSRSHEHHGAPRSMLYLDQHLMTSRKLHEDIRQISSIESTGISLLSASS